MTLRLAVLVASTREKRFADVPLAWATRLLEQRLEWMLDDLDWWGTALAVARAA